MNCSKLLAMILRIFKSIYSKNAMIPNKSLSLYECVCNCLIVNFQHKKTFYLKLKIGILSKTKFNLNF